MNVIGKRMTVILLCFMMLLFLLPNNAQAEEDMAAERETNLETEPVDDTEEPTEPETDFWYHTDLILDKNNLEMGMGDTEQLVPTLDPSIDTPDQEVFWASSNPAVASVDSDGNVTAHKIGTTKISCQVTLGLYYDTCDVRVTFRDVPWRGQYYSTPVYWGYNRGITKGYSSGEYDKCFGVGLNCKRKDLAIFMWRYAGKPADYGDARDMFNDMDDYGTETSANKAVAWAASNGITKGYSDGGFHPEDPIIRKDVMIMLYRMGGSQEVSGTLAFTDCQDFDVNSDTYKAILWGSQKNHKRVFRRPLCRHVRS